MIDFSFVDGISAKLEDKNGSISISWYDIPGPEILNANRVNRYKYMQNVIGWYSLFSKWIFTSLTQREIKKNAPRKPYCAMILPYPMSGVNVGLIILFWSTRPILKLYSRFATSGYKGDMKPNKKTDSTIPFVNIYSALS